jgi:hypothetical protein
MTKLTDSEGAPELSTIEYCDMHLENPLSGDSTGLTPLFHLAPKGRHMRYHPQLPLAMPKTDPKKIIRKGKTPQEGTSTAEPGDSGNFHHPPSETPLAASYTPIISSIRVSRALNFGSFPVVFSSPGLGLEGESFDTTVSPEFVPWLRPETLGNFSTPCFTIPSPIRVVVGEASFPTSSATIFPRSIFLVSPF